MEGHALWGSQRPGTLPRTDEQNFVHTEAQALVQEFISRGEEMEAHIDDVSLGTNTKRTMSFSSVIFSLFVRKTVS